MQKARSQGLRPSYRLSAHGFRIYFTRHLACFSPFPHGTSALSVIEEYLGLEGGPPCFPQGFSCLVVLWNLLAPFHFRIQDSYLLWWQLSICSSASFPVTCCSPQPPKTEVFRFGLFRFRSPLLTESRLISLPGAT